MTEQQKPASEPIYRIKPLEWEERHTLYGECRHADSAIGEYRIYQRLDGLFDWVLGGSGVLRKALSVESCKAACEAEHRERLLADLIEVKPGEVEEALKLVDENLESVKAAVEEIG